MTFASGLINLKEDKNELEIGQSLHDDSVSIVGSLELLTDDEGLEAAHQEIVQMFDEALLRSGEEINRE